MISKPLFKTAIKQNFIVFLIIVAVLMVYLPIIITMYDPSTQESLNQILDVMPQALIAAMGFSEIGGSLIDFIASYFYGFLILLLPMIYVIIVCNRSIASLLTRSTAYLLSTPNTRQNSKNTGTVRHNKHRNDCPRSGRGWR